MKRFTVLTHGLLPLIFIFITSAAFSQVTVQQSDSSYWSLSLPELQSYKAYYIQELEALYQEKRNLILRGIDDGERLLASKPDDQVVDEIQVRLADLYYYLAKDNYLREMEAFDQALMQYEQGTLTEPPEEPRLNLTKSLSIYQRIIDEFPQSDLIDDAVYNKGYLYEEMGENQKAIQVYLYLIDAYPESKYIAEAYMRLGENHFNPPISDVEKAITYYKEVLQFPESLRYNEALYKLGWAYYRLSQYPESISYFTTLVDDHVNKEEAEDDVSLQADLFDESLEYIAISFIDFGGASKAVEYLKGINNPEWGWHMLKALGYVYMDQKEEYLLAIETYERLLAYNPFSSEAPEVQKNIVDCYRILEDDANAFVARQKLFLKYKAGTAWWNANTSEEVKLKAYRLAEKSARENINELTQKANQRGKTELYQKVLELSSTYLDAFPEDKHAYMIRWNTALILDTKLQHYKEALQQYLTISMVYNTEEYKEFAREMGLASIQDAATNAIVVADTMVRQESRRSGRQIKEAQAMDFKVALTERAPVPLTASESWLAMSYDNYIKLFPFEPNTPNILSSAGALYYTHNQFTEALKYFKTLIKYFPDSDEVDNAQYSILESYFGKNDFQSVEFLAKRILSSDASDEIKQKAQQRLAEAIFLNAESMSQAGTSNQAAEEYFRMATEIPNAEFADRALFNAGQEYEKTNHFREAIRAYELLRSSYPGSAYFTDALNNLAYDYGEIGQFNRAGETYEALWQRVPDQNKKQNALYNAWVFYVKAENWQKALSTGGQFAREFPQAEEATTVYFKCGEFAQNLKAFEAAVRVFEDYVTRFPNSALAVEALYRMGKIKYDTKQVNQAASYFSKAFEKNEFLQSAGLENNAYFASEALFMQADIDFEKYKKIKFKQPEHVLNFAAEQKQTLLKTLTDQYTQVVAFGTSRLPEALYRLGRCNEIYAEDWAGQELPGLDANQLAVKERKINADATQYYGYALAAYMKSDQALRKLIQTTQEEATRDTLSADPADADSLIQTAVYWRQQSRDKISEILYKAAELNTQTVERLASVPVPADLSLAAQLEYKSQVLIKAVKPTLDVVVTAHLRNVNISDSLRLQNSWIDSSRNQIISSLIYLGEAYGHLSRETIGHFNYGVNTYREWVLQKNQAAPQELMTSNLHLLDLCKSYTLASVAFYKNAYQRLLREDFSDQEQTEVQDAMILNVIGIIDSLQRQVQISVRDQKAANKKFIETENVLYEDALAVFEDHDYFINENLKIILDTTYEQEKQFASTSNHFNDLVLSMIQHDPKHYGQKLNIKIQTVTIPTDTTWLYSVRTDAHWNTPEFEDGLWKGTPIQGRQLFHWDDINVKTLAIADSLEQKASRPCFLRKTFYIDGYPLDCDANVKSNSRTKLFCNGKLVAELDNESPLKLSSLLNSGKNVIAVAGVLNSKYLLEGFVQINYIRETEFEKLRR